MVGISLAIGLAFGEASGATFPVEVVGFGYAMFAWLYRSWHVAAVALASALGVLVMAVYGTRNTEDLTSLAVGAVGCFPDSWQLLQERHAKMFRDEFSRGTHEGRRL